MGPGESFALPCIYTVATKKRGDFSSLSFSDPGGARTHDPMIKSHLLYQLSHGVIMSCISFPRL